jgi:hypothetical protein
VLAIPPEDISELIMNMDDVPDILKEFLRL